MLATIISTPSYSHSYLNFKGECKHDIVLSQILLIIQSNK